MTPPAEGRLKQAVLCLRLLGSRVESGERLSKLLHTGVVVYQERDRKRWDRSRAACIAVVLAWLCAPASWAAGTAAGTLIGNTATLTYTAAGGPGTATATARPIVVARVINVTVS